VKIYIGYDADEELAYNVALDSLGAWSHLQAEPLDAEKLSAQGLFCRQIDNRGQKYDLPSNAPCSTDFAVTRFLVPLLCQKGWALFVDCDVVFMANPVKIMKHADRTKAVVVVQHNHTGGGEKMGGMIQTSYPRKNWSSVMLFNCNHPANQRLTINDISTRPGRDLHRFYWLHDSEIGSMPGQWNWLVGVEPKPAEPKIAHFTKGGPWIQGWQETEHDELWLEYAQGKV